MRIAWSRNVADICQFVKGFVWQVCLMYKVYAVQPAGYLVAIPPVTG